MSSELYHKEKNRLSRLIENCSTDKSYYGGHLVEQKKNTLLRQQEIFNSFSENEWINNLAHASINRYTTTMKNWCIEEFKYDPYLLEECAAIDDSNDTKISFVFHDAVDGVAFKLRWC